MTSIRIVSTAGVVVMTVAVVIGFISGGFAREGGAILDLVWGRITLVDLYVGIALMSMWVGWRERSIARALAWMAVFIVLGNLATATYVAKVAWSSKSVDEFLVGRSATAATSSG